MEKLPFLSFDKHKQCAIRSHASFLLSLFFSLCCSASSRTLWPFACRQQSSERLTSAFSFALSAPTDEFTSKNARTEKPVVAEAKARYRNQLDYNTGDVRPQYLIGRPQHICIPVYNDIYTKECFVHFCTIYSD